MYIYITYLLNFVNELIICLFPYFHKSRIRMNFFVPLSNLTYQQCSSQESQHAQEYEPYL